MSSTRTILVLAANPADTERIRLDDEIREIEDSLKRAKERDRFVFHQRLATRLKDVRRAMLELRPNIVHFCGHAESSGIVLEDDTKRSVLVPIEPLAALFNLFSPDVQCVLLNACYSEAQASVIAHHVPYVVGMRNVIDDRAAIKFAVTFYDALGAGESFESAYDHGCNELELAGFPKYMRPILITAPVTKTVGYRTPAEPLLGREHDILHAAKLLRNCSLAFVGIKGIGKSKLASAVFEHLLAEGASPFSTYYWRQLTYGEPPPFAAFGRQLVHDLTGRDIDFTMLGREEQVQLVLETMRRARCLLVIDQFEALIDRTTLAPSEVAYAEFLRYLRDGVGFGRVLITSWEIPTDSSGSQFPYLRITGIPRDAAIALLEQEVGAAENRGGGDLRPLFERLASYVQDHPLALVLLARNYPLVYLMDLARAFTNWDHPVEEIATQIVGQILARISENTDLRRLLAGVCVFSGPTDIDSVLATSGLPRHRARIGLNELVQRGLLSLLPNGLQDVHALVRDHVLGTLSPQDRKSLHEKAAAFFMQTTFRAQKERRSIEDVRPLLSAIEHLLGAGDVDDAANLFVEEDLPDQLYGWGHLSELLRLYTRFLKGAIDPQVRVLFGGRLGLVHRDLADFEKAMECYRAALSLAREQQDTEGEATQLVNIGDVYHYLGQPESSVTFHKKALALIEDIDSDALAARNRGCLGNALEALGKDDEAISYYETAIGICRKIGDRRYEGIWTGDLANVYAKKGDSAKAVELYDEALGIARSVGDKMHESWWAGVLGGLYAERQEYEKGFDYLERALAMSSDILYRRGMRAQIVSLLECGWAANRVPQVMQVLASIKALAEETQGPGFGFVPTEYLLAKSIFERAESVEEQGDYEQAAKHYGEAGEIEFVKARAVAQRARCLRMLAYTPDRADEYLRAAIEEYSLAISLEPSEGAYHMLRGACHAQRGDLRRALADYGTALARNPSEGLAVLAKMEAEICLGEHEQALRTYEGLDREVLPPNQQVISAWLICIAKALVGKSYDDDLPSLVDTDVILTDRADWCPVEMERYLAQLESKLTAALFKRVSGIHAMFRRHFSES